MENFSLTEVRARNLRRIAEDLGSKTELARRVGRSPQSIGGVINGTRVCGDRLARDIEKLLEMPRYSLDKDDEAGVVCVPRIGSTAPEAHQTGVPQTPVQATPLVPVIPVDDSRLKIPVLEVGLSAPRNVSYVLSVEIDKAWLNAQPVTTSSPSALRIFCSPGDNMAPLIRKNSMVIVDTAQTVLNSNGVYAVQYSGSIFIHRVQILPGGKFRLLSDNAAYSPIDSGDVNGVRIIGACVMSLDANAL